MAKGVTLEEFIQNNPDCRNDLYPHLVEFVNTCLENNYFHLDIRPDKIVVERKDFIVEDISDNNKRISFTKYYFRYLDFLNYTELK